MRDQTQRDKTPKFANHKTDNFEPTGEQELEQYDTARTNMNDKRMNEKADLISNRSCKTHITSENKELAREREYAILRLIAKDLDI